MKLTRPDGTTYSEMPLVETGKADTLRAKLDLGGAPLAGDWRLELTLGAAAPCAYGVSVV